ncbi:GntR family transcriptional regulator [Kineosporia mesophila]|uniref:GntR family transcriptional regulator n=1 Tax=Kineosporia mesophila TaxID=566012 RepID=UPI001E334D42|nr:GntR family transcriptional regulator [Kineosporia mesophila]
MPSSTKRHLVAETLRAEITAGRHAPGERLPGEHELAQRFAVSRGTVRAALAELADQDYIDTRGGIGSVVTFDGAVLDPRSGWARSIDAVGVEVRTRVLRIATVVDEVLAAEIGSAVTAFVAIDRMRLADDVAISLERSRVPLTGALRRVLTDGLVDDSITATLDGAGLVPARAEQWVDVVPLDTADAERLGRPPGTPFLHSRRVSHTATGDFVENVESLLAPERFRLHMRFGGAQ